MTTKPSTSNAYICSALSAAIRDGGGAGLDGLHVQEAIRGARPASASGAAARAGVHRARRPRRRYAHNIPPRARVRIFLLELAGGRTYMLMESF
jgi:hypothetical protein